MESFVNMATLLNELLTSSGIDITPGGVFCDEPSRAVRKLESNIRLQNNRFKDFLEELEKYLNANLEQILSPICSSEKSTDGMYKYQQLGLYIGQGDSFLKLLLRIQSIQSQLMNLLMQKLVECSFVEAEKNLQNGTETSTSDSNMKKNSDSNFSSIIINHIRYCETIFQPRNLLTLIMDTISILSYSIQVEIISALPGMSNENFLYMYLYE